MSLIEDMEGQTRLRLSRYPTDAEIRRAIAAVLSGSRGLSDRDRIEEELFVRLHPLGPLSAFLRRA